ncbi:metallophosphoesterase domain-containing protein 1 isoform X2 [Arctopsyche grandis]|uniref:metallophosphoesterase domain-containing protein 1 isoform X2 n=1 Tax=Arctopsyche grandis TaxID=121162 RepID=UPI00406D8EE6
MEVCVHPLSASPCLAWRDLSASQRVIRVAVAPPVGPAPPGAARVVCMSDTHALTPHLRLSVPPGDIFIHAGDFTRCGHPDEVADFNQWLGKLPHKHKIVIAGNHELSFDKNFTHPLKNVGSVLDDIPTLGMARDKLSDAINSLNVKNLLTNCTYLEDASVEIYGIKIYGTPWQPEFWKWAFNIPRGSACLEKWMKIPLDTDILVSHTPPIGHGDLCCSGVRAGCVELLSVLQQRLNVKYHVFGHVHEGRRIPGIYLCKNKMF